MDNLKLLEDSEIIELIKSKKITVADIVDSGICPTCFDKKNNNILYGDNKDTMIYEDDKFECFLAKKPRADGHTIISTKNHYKDMMEIDDIICKIYISKKSYASIKKSI